jgi:hypothetical protein
LQAADSEHRSPDHMTFFNYLSICADVIQLCTLYNFCRWLYNLRQRRPIAIDV